MCLRLFPLLFLFFLFMCLMPCLLPLTGWLVANVCMCAFPLPRPHPFSRCINVCVYPFLWLFSLTSLMNVCVFNFASFLAFSYSLYCRLCFTSFLLLPLAHRLIDWMNVCVCVCVLLLIDWINAFVFLYLSLVFEGPRTGNESKSAWTVQYQGCTQDSHVFFIRRPLPSLFQLSELIC